jgi:hypothetical protein
VPVQKYIASPTTSGVALKEVRVAPSLPSERSPCRYSQATASAPTFARVTWFKGDQWSPPWSPPYSRHSAVGPETSSGECRSQAAASAQAAKRANRAARGMRPRTLARRGTGPARYPRAPRFSLELTTPPYEVRCEACKCSFAAGTKRCVHCGGPLGASFDLAMLRAGGRADGDVSEVAADAPSKGRMVLWIVSAAVAIGANLLRNCAER